MRKIPIKELYKHSFGPTTLHSGMCGLFFRTIHSDKNWERITAKMSPDEKLRLAAETPTDEDFSSPSFFLLRAIGFFSIKHAHEALHNLHLAKKINGEEIERLAHRIYRSYKNGSLEKESEKQELLLDIDALERSTERPAVK